MNKLIALFANKWSKRILTSLFLLYLYPIFIAPFLDLKISADELDSIYQWQTLILGFLVLVSSLIFFYTIKYKENKQQERNFAAEKLFLPEAMCELSKYLVLSAKYLGEAWESLDNFGYEKPLIEISKHNLPKNYRETFKQCIRYADEDFSAHLTSIIKLLQLYSKRADNLTNDLKMNPSRTALKIKIKDLYRSLGLLQGLIVKTLDCSNSGRTFEGGEMERDDVVDAYINLKIPMERIEALLK